MTAGRAFRGGTCRLGHSIFEVVQENKEKQNKIERLKSQKARQAHQKKLEAAATVKALGKESSQLSVAQLKTLLAPLKCKGDKAIPTRKADLLTRLMEWESRGGLLVNKDCGAMEDNANDSNSEAIFDPGDQMMPADNEEFLQEATV